MTPEQFIAKWEPVELTERSAAQQHFIDLCRLLEQPTPAEADPTGETYTFEKGATKANGGRGWADVWKRGVFGWEYKGPDKDLQRAYSQLKEYADALENPPLLITSDIKRIEIHTNFTNTVKTVYSLALSDLTDARKREILRWAFAEPEKLRPGVTRAMVTVQAAERFSELAHRLQAKGYEPTRVAHFLNRLIFSMFAEDVGLLPNNVFNKMLTAAAAHPESFEHYARDLFRSMAKGGSVAFEVIEWFNGGLFDDESTLPLDKEDIRLLLKSADLDWTWIEPSIFGTLFERGLDPDKRSQQGTHYTDPDTIMKLVKPVVLDPWEDAWAAEKKALAALIERSKKGISDAAKKRYFAFLERICRYRVLDPACGSGNFLYLTLRGLKNFEKKVIHEAEALGLPRQFPRVGPEAVLGIEVNPYAVELARVTVWIGEIQWMLENGFGVEKNPILKSLAGIECRDAVLNEDGSEPEWPQADAIVGNPPFLGSQFMIRGLGEEYTDKLRGLFADRLPGGIDLCCYWFEKAHAMLKSGTNCVGLVATQAIRAGRNRAVLERITQDATLFNAWADEPWVNEGASVRVSLVCFRKKDAVGGLALNGEPVEQIFADLEAGQATGGMNLTLAKKLPENREIAFQGPVKVGPFDISGEMARTWLTLPNPHGKANSEVIRPWANGQDVTRRPSDTWIIDFGEMSEKEAALYEKPFEHVRVHVKPMRDAGRREGRKRYWWRHGETVPAMRRALAPLRRYIATCRVSKHRFFTWLPSCVLPDSRLYVIASESDVMFGLLSTKLHEVWSLANASMHGVGNDPTYTAGACFETYPFPEGLTPDVPAGAYEQCGYSQRIAAAARRLNELRENWLNPPELIDRVPEVVPGYPDRRLPKNGAAALELKKRTLTGLYNTNPQWLQHAHRELDEAVAAAYGWDWPLSDDEILRRLLELNQARAMT